MADSGINWDEVYREAKEITDVPWETVEPSEEIVRLVKEGKIKPCKALDMGCGFGTQAIFLAQQGFEVKAFDFSEQAIRVARQRAEKQKVKVDFFVGDINILDLKETFSFVLDRGLFHVLGKKDRAGYIKKVHGMLEPKGKFSLAVFSEKNTEEEGPFLFTQKEIEDLFSSPFNILEVEEIVHVVTGKKFVQDKAYLYSVFMEKR